MKLFSQFFCKVLIYDRIKNRENEYKEFGKRYKIPLANFFASLTGSFFSSFITVLATHPYELAYTRMVGRFNSQYPNMKSCFHEMNHVKIGDAIVNVPKDKIIKPKKESPIIKYYTGLPAAFYQSVVYSTISLIGYQFIYDNINSSKNEKFKTLMLTSLVGLVSAAVSYPFDTLKRQIMVNGANGYQLEYKYFYEAMNKFFQSNLNYHYK